MERYWLRVAKGAWQEVTQKQFAKAERDGGFRPHSSDELATTAFSSGSVDGVVTHDSEVPEGFTPTTTAIGEKGIVQVEGTPDCEAGGILRL